MRNFILFFFGHEGSSPLHQLLKQLAPIHLVDFEPFDRYVFLDAERKGRGRDISRDDLLRCLRLIYQIPRGADAAEQLNAIYTKYRRKRLRLPGGIHACVGLKMRIHQREKWESHVLEILRACGVVAFVLQRNDILRWALSRYDRERSQFDRPCPGESAATGARIQVDIPVLRSIMLQCDRDLRQKRKLLDRIRRAGVEAHVLSYEEFCGKKEPYLRNLLSILEVTVSDEAFHAALQSDQQFRKVHSDRIEAFVANPRAVICAYRFHCCIMAPFDRLLDGWKDLRVAVARRVPRPAGKCDGDGLASNRGDRT